MKPKDNKPKFIFASTMCSFIVPVVAVVWFSFSYDFTSPDGSPDNGPIRSIPAIFIFSIFVFIFQLAAYAALGDSVYRQHTPDIKPGVLYASVLAIPLSVFIYFVITMPAQSDPPSTLLAIGMALQFFCFLWLSFITGAFAQLWLIKKNNK